MTKLILTVDDSASMRMLLKVSLTSQGYAIQGAEDGVHDAPGKQRRQDEHQRGDEGQRQQRVQRPVEEPALQPGQQADLHARRRPAGDGGEALLRGHCLSVP